MTSSDESTRFPGSDPDPAHGADADVTADMPQHGHSAPVLSEADARALDLWVDLGFEPAAVAAAVEHGRVTLHDGMERTLDAGEVARLLAVSRVLRRLDALRAPVADPTLLDVTLAGIDRHERAQAERLRFELDAAGPRRGRPRVPDLVAVAAILLIVASVALPLLDTVRQRSTDARCVDTLRRLGTGFIAYARDHADGVPTALAGSMLRFPSRQEIMNPAPLVDLGYCDLGHLGCPGHHGDIRTLRYGHQVIPAGLGSGTQRRFRISWTAPTIITGAMGDRSPLADAWLAGGHPAPMAAAESHGGRGQAILRTDGAVLWLLLPVVDRQDNIWLPHGALELSQDAEPASPADCLIIN